jgi:hypothetical protein
LLPAAIDNIRQKAFASCTSLANITVKCTYPPTLTEDAFDNNTSQNSKLYVNDVDNYNSTEEVTNDNTELSLFNEQ